ncbi:N-formylglutamate amidohydrolase [Chelatococcus sp. SYSU_G07232]|uniref:N-formylglutamate amidohydrolase n=1 Tax=Chelatococcus albus TaxID=3047466 RepID=A0ABT7AFZ8_9HYPH|nr:N-formylglutamate amidohydrolase [Chelatococcus sp. SYSU_G07232]MDJ1158297.1 N-formylglutamate amidohydrolase [Chelatococcus sp. SYSU_G07232]
MRRLPPSVPAPVVPDATDEALSITPWPIEAIGGDPATGLLLLCDHASNEIPAEYDSLGLPPRELERHIAYDIGAAAVTRRMAELTGAPAILTRFSRLLIDPNRGADDPTLVMRLSDGAIVPGNARIDEAEVARRIARFYRPYDAAIRATIDASLAAGVVPAVVSIHSFTPVWRGSPRPWHAGVLWDADPRLAAPLIAALRAEGDIVVGDNEPYDGALVGDTLNRHATVRGLPHALVEVRQDLIADAAGARGWGDRLVRLLRGIGEETHLRSIEHFPSRTAQRR